MVRIASPGDYKLLHSLADELGYKPLEEDEVCNRLRILIESDRDRVWVLEDQGLIKGWIHVFIAHRLASKSFVEIGGIVVDSKHRRMGVGRVLVMQAGSWAKGLDMLLRVRCNARREDSYRFYQALGFDQIKQQKIFELATSSTKQV